MRQQVEEAVCVSEARRAAVLSDFEKILRAHFPTYTKLEAQAWKEWVDTKPFGARWVAERIDYDGSEGWVKFREMFLKIFVLLNA
ncbi:MAG TPA: hypothetical protein VIA62_11845 [Thermoanaerobaculia bacterium]|nr:hypothetical protein [Thermoanaerobaculia bacterium]